MAEAFVRGRRKEDRETQMTTVCWANRAKGNERPPPKLERVGQAPGTFRLERECRGGMSRRFWV